MKNFLKKWGLVIGTFGFYSLAYGASSSEMINQIMEYIKWIVGIVASVVGIGAVGYYMYGGHLAQAGDQRGESMKSNALKAAAGAAIGWAVVGALILKGAEMGTSTQGVDAGWQ